MTKLRLTIIIPTLNRPDELRNCIQSILDQTLLPDELVVVDDGELPEVPLRRECEARGMQLLYHRKTERGLTASRNVGISMATGDILFFLDDDVVLFPDYVEQIRQAFDSPGREVTGVGGTIANLEPRTLKHRLRHWLDVIFLVSGTREGRVLPSGFSVDYGSTGRNREEIFDVDFLPGGVSAYRKELFAHFSFSEKYAGYGMGEDKDFSYRVSRRYRLVVNPLARLYHYESPKMRFDRHRETREIVMGRYHLFNDYVKHNVWHWLLFYYAVFGYLLGRLLIWLLSPGKNNWDRVRGICAALGDILRRRVSIG